MIILRKNGIFYKDEVDFDDKDVEYRPVNSVIPYLNDIIEIEEDFTLKDFFLCIEQDEKMLNIVFSSYLGNCPLTPYISEIKQDCIPDAKEEMERIECCWETEQFDYDLFYKVNKDNIESFLPELSERLHEPDKEEGNEISIYVDVYGWGPYIPEKGNKSFKKGQQPIYSSYGIEFIPLHRLAHVPIKLNTNFEMRGQNATQYEKPIVQGEKFFTVFDIFGAIFSEISFCGLPEERDEAWIEILDEMENTNEQEEYNDDDNDEYNDDDNDDDNNGEQ